MSDSSQQSGSNLGGEAAPAGSMTGRWRLFLLASLALNLMLAGATAGHFIYAKRHHVSGSGGARGAPELALQGFLKTLPKDRAKELRQLIKTGERTDQAPLFASVRKARRDAAQVLSAENFDRAKLAAAFANIDAADAAAKAAARMSLLALADHMTAAERLAMAERWKARRPQLFDEAPASDDAPPQ